jgi:hypothetical protein
LSVDDLKKVLRNTQQLIEKIKDYRTDLYKKNVVPTLPDLVKPARKSHSPGKQSDLIVTSPDLAQEEFEKFKKSQQGDFFHHR